MLALGVLQDDLRTNEPVMPGILDTCELDCFAKTGTSMDCLH